MRALVFSIAALALPAHAQDAADQYFDPAEMAKARHHLYSHHGGGSFSYIEGERFEYRSGEGAPHLLWDAQGWYGGDINKLWVKTEGEFDFEADEIEGGEVQALWSRAVTPFFDAQAGIRQDYGEGPDRTHGVVGLQGLTPYLFEIDAAAFISNKGDVTARIEAEYELLITQRLILQPRTELELAAQDSAELSIGGGLSEVELGARLRYEIKREVAPYVGVSWERALGDTADFVRADGDDPSTVSFVAGVRFWF